MGPIPHPVSGAHPMPLHRSRALTVAAAVLLLPPAAAQVTAIRAGRVVDPETGTAAANQVILVENGKITAAGANVTVPRGATVIDLSRATILPGLFDAHTHLCMSVQLGRDAGSYYLTTLRDPDSCAGCGERPRDARGGLHHRAGHRERGRLRLHQRALGDRARPRARTHDDQRRAHHRALRRAVPPPAGPPRPGRARVLLCGHAR